LADRYGAVRLLSIEAGRRNPATLARALCQHGYAGQARV
jgi:hypothetical protein